MNARRPRHARVRSRWRHRDAHRFPVSGAGHVGPVRSGCRLAGDVARGRPERASHVAARLVTRAGDTNGCRARNAGAPRRRVSAGARGAALSPSRRADRSAQQLRSGAVRRRHPAMALRRRARPPSGLPLHRDASARRPRVASAAHAWRATSLERGNDCRRRAVRTPRPPSRRSGLRAEQLHA